MRPRSTPCPRPARLQQGRGGSLISYSGVVATWSLPVRSSPRWAHRSPHQTEAPRAAATAPATRTQPDGACHFLSFGLSPCGCGRGAALCGAGVLGGHSPARAHAGSRGGWGARPPGSRGAHRGPSPAMPEPCPAHPAHRQAQCREKQALAAASSPRCLTLTSRWRPRRSLARSSPVSRNTCPTHRHVTRADRQAGSSPLALGCGVGCGVCKCMQVRGMYL